MSGDTFVFGRYQVVRSDWLLLKHACSFSSLFSLSFIFFVSVAVIEFLRIENLPKVMNIFHEVFCFVCRALSMNIARVHHLRSPYLLQMSSFGLRHLNRFSLQ